MYQNLQCLPIYFHFGWRLQKENFFVVSVEVLYKIKRLCLWLYKTADSVNARYQSMKQRNKA